MRRRGLAFALAVAAALGAIPAPARADGVRPDWAFGHPAGDAVIFATAAGSNFFALLPQGRSGWAPSHTLPDDTTVAKWSDLTGAVGGLTIQLGLGYVLESAYLDAVGAEDPGVEALFGTMVETQAVGLSSGVTFLMKRLTGRCRPRAYASGVCDGEFDSFPSGHTSAISPFAGARLVRLIETPGEGIAYRAINYGVAELGTIVTAILRNYAGAHSWEDVLVGGLVGHSAGVLVGLAHRPVDVERGPGKARGAIAGTTPISLPAPTTFEISFAF